MSGARHIFSRLKKTFFTRRFEANAYSSVVKNATEKYTTPYYMFYVCVTLGMSCFRLKPSCARFHVTFFTTIEDGSTLENVWSKKSFFRARHIAKKILMPSTSYSNICVTQSNLLFGTAHVYFYFQSTLTVNNLTSDRTLFWLINRNM